MSGTTTFANPSVPSLADFLIFIQNVMQVPSADLPSNSPWPQIAYNVAMETVAPKLQLIAPQQYVLALYNLAAHTLLLICPDQPGQTFFADAVTGFGLNNFIAGPVASAADQGTSASLLIPDFYKTMTLQDYQFLKTPYGRTYLAIAQNLGGLWGIT